MKELLKAKQAIKEAEKGTKRMAPIVEKMEKWLNKTALLNARTYKG